jgi:hypothetical protein
LARWTSRRARFALVVPTTLALLAPTAAVAQGTHDPSEAAGGWLASQLVDDERIEVTFDFGDGPQTFDDHGLTADVVIALAGAGVAAGHIESATDWLEDETGAYTGLDWGDVYAGAVAKLLIVAATTDRAPEDFDGQDLVTLLEDREQDSGRFTDDTDGDFSSVITQSLAVIGLERAADTTPSDTAVDYLAAQACDEGGFPQALDADECVPQVDATGFAVQALLSVGETAAAADAVSWLLDQQEDDGGFVGDEGTANANSTGLATIALLEAGEDDAAVLGQEFLLTLQAGCDDPDTASIRYDAADGGDRVRATAQALPALSGFGLASVSAEGAMDALPSFDCPFPDVDEDNVHYTAIHDLRARGIISGRADGTFGPAAAVTRGQLAAIVARAAELDPVDPDDADERFSDVDGHTHEGAIYALAEAEVVAGYGDGTFRPNVPVQRDQAASLLARWLGLAPVDEDQFTDLEGNVHREQINALAEIDVALGTEDGEYLPGRSIRRDQTASLVLRALHHTEREAEEDDAATAAR